ncbi:MAG: thiosulfate oxidation carrier complex protein SoxZ [Gallionella sp.]|nr:thiosulfate oxidation carrier complex protein SoxZ [Gallionella sp.]
MQNGRRKDVAGNLIPAWYITGIKAHHNGKIVLDGRFGTAVSKTLSGVSLHGRSGGR